MQTSGKVYEISGETTEWEDILIKKGIKTKEDIFLEKGLNPLDFIKKEEIIPERQIESKEPNDLDDDLDDEDTKALDFYREQRLRQLKEQVIKNRFGDVLEITKDEWVREVTEASNSCWVVTHLYQDSVLECRIVEEAFIQLASKFKYVKFIKIRSTQAVENWPEKNLPTLFFYHKGELQQQIITLRELGGRGMRSEDLEWWMKTHGDADESTGSTMGGMVPTSELEENPRNGSRLRITSSGGGRGESDEDDDDDGRRNPRVGRGRGVRYTASDEMSEEEDL